MQDVLAAMRSNGFEIDSVVLDGRIHRSGDKKKSNWYIGFQNHARSTGQVFQVVLYGSWKTNEIYTYKTDDVDYSPEDRAFIKKKIEEAQKKAEKEKEELQLAVARECQKFVEQGSTSTESARHAYLERKGLDRLFGSFVFRGDLYVPMRDVDGTLWGVQKIQDDGSKFFWPGQKVSGTFHCIGDLHDARTIYLCEGFATGASIHRATNGCVVMSFTSHNLVQVGEILKRRFPDRCFVVCGDEDRWTKNSQGDAYNPGRESAERCAERILGTAIFPEFGSLDSHPTDFNDLELLEGTDRVRAQILGTKPRRNFVVALGFREKEYFYTSTSNRQIVGIKSFSDIDFFNLMPREYWEAVYPGKRAPIDWSHAKSDMMEQCRAKGFFEYFNVRGAGVWMDNNRVVVNQGDHLLVDGEPTDFFDIRSKYFYTLGKHLPKTTLELATDQDRQLLLDICEAFRWKKPDSAKLMVGLLITSKVCGALPVRPHVWLTGGSQTGKTTLLQNLIFPTLRNYSLYFLGGTSEAGLRQSLGSDSVPVIFDEFETNGPKSSENIQACVELMRSAWSETDGYIAKGSTSGNASFYQPRFSAIVSSIRTNLINDADRSRFTIMELAPHGSDQAQWKYLSSILAMYRSDVVERLFAFTLRNMPVLLANYETLRKVLATRVGARFGQQLGMLLAGYALIRHAGSVISVDTARDIADSLTLDDEEENAKLTDELELVGYIATHKIKHERGEDSISRLIELASSQTALPGAHGDILEKHGIKVSGDHVFVANRHFVLENQILVRSRWQNCWPQTLSRLEGSQKNALARFCSKVTRCTKVPLFHFISK